MPGRTTHRLCSTHRVAFAVLIFTLPQLLIACSSGPQVPPQAAADTRTVKVDPFDGLPPSDQEATPPARKPAAPAPPTVTEAEMGMPFYPGAMQYSEPGAGPDVAMAGGSDATLLLQTHDPASKVIAFYQDKLTGPDVTGKIGPPSRRDGSRDGKPTITLSISEGHTLKAVEIRELDNLTIIELMRLEMHAPGKAVLPGSAPGQPAGGAPGARDGMVDGPATGDKTTGDSFSGGSPVAPGKPGTGTKTPQRSLQYP